MPENLRLLLIMEPEDFDTLVKEIVPPWAELDTDQPDRFVYTTKVGIEFGIKKKDYNGGLQYGNIPNSNRKPS